MFTPIVSSQSHLEIGFRIDLPLLGPFTTYSNPQSCDRNTPCGSFQSAAFHPAVGLSTSIPVTRRFSLRFDPLYQRVGLDTTSYSFVYQSTADSPLGEVVSKRWNTADRWQFPALVQAELLPHVHFGIGPAVSLLTGTEGTVKVVNPFSGTSTFVGRSISVARQAVAGAGAALEFPFRFSNVTLAPELRYKRWFARHYPDNWSMDEFTLGVALRFARR